MNQAADMQDDNLNEDDVVLNDDQLNDDDALELDDGDSADVDDEQDDEQAAEGKQEKQHKDPSTYIDFDKPLDKERVKARIAADTGKRKKLEDDLKTERDRRIALERQVLAQTKPQEVPIPDKDLAYSDPDEYARQMQAHYDAKQKLQEHQQQEKDLDQRAQTDEQRARAAQLQEVETAFVTNATARGYTEAQIKKAADTVAAHFDQIVATPQDQAKRQELVHFMLSHEQGSRMLDHFARKPDELSQLMGLSSAQAGYRLGEIARSLTQQSHKSNTPPPDEPLRGGGAKPSESPFLKGATFE